MYSLVFFTFYGYITNSQSDINARIPLLLATMVPVGLELDLAAHQGVVCIAVRAVVRACVENVLNGGLSDQDEIQLVAVF